MAAAAATAATAANCLLRRTFFSARPTHSRTLFSSSSLPFNTFTSHRHRHRHRALHSSLAQPTQTQQAPATTCARPNVVDILEERGLLESITSDTLRSICSDPTRPPLKVYCGFDPTAESLHLGNLLGLIVLSWFLRTGHHAVALLGGATARVGDPSGKSLERPELDPVTLDANTASIKDIIVKIAVRSLPSGGAGRPFQVLNNYDWWKDVRLLHFLKEVGRYARVGTMMSKESVKKRLESDQGMSYTEFTYQLLQGYDFVHLFRQEGVNVQIGGSDQWGNITAGTELTRKILQLDDKVYGLTFPLLLKSDGTKFGKSEDGAIWLSPSHLSPYKFYQYLFSVPDADVIRFLKILTFLSMEEIAEIERDMGRPGYVPNTAQRRLAEEVTRFVHGDEGLKEAVKATEALRPGSDTKLDLQMIEAILEDGNVPSCLMAYNEVLNLPILDLSVSAGLFESKSAARRLIKQGGLYMNNARVESEMKKIEADDIVDGKVILLSAGKKNKIVKCLHHGGRGNFKNSQLVHNLFSVLTDIGLFSGFVGTIELRVKGQTMSNFCRNKARQVN